MGIGGMIDELEMNNGDKGENKNIKVNVGDDTNSRDTLDKI